jgi:hypothetical protein
MPAAATHVEEITRWRSFQANPLANPFPLGMSGKEERWRWLSVWLYRRWLDDRSKRAEEMTMPDGAKLPQDVKPRGEYRTMRGNDVIKAIEGVEQRRKQKRYVKLKCAAACKNKACHGEPLRRCMQQLLTSGARQDTTDTAAATAQQGGLDAEDLGNVVTTATPNPAEARGVASAAIVDRMLVDDVGAVAVTATASHATSGAHEGEVPIEDTTTRASQDRKGGADDGDETSELEMTAEEDDEYDREREQAEVRAASMTLAQGGGTSAIALEAAAVDDAAVGVRDDGDDGQEPRAAQKKKRRHTRSVRLEERKRRRTDDNDDNGSGGGARGQGDGRG